MCDKFKEVSRWHFSAYLKTYQNKMETGISMVERGRMLIVNDRKSHSEIGFVKPSQDHHTQKDQYWVLDNEYSEITYH